MEENKYYFQKLTPISNADISVYEKAIDFVFENKDIKNVAISGAYSAGKSSVLETYKIKNTNYRFVHISLAHFHTLEQEINDPEDRVKESILEGKILNQLLHQIASEKIPQSNFRVKKGVSRCSLIKLTATISIFICSLSLIIFSPDIITFIAELQNNWIKYILSIIFNAYTVIISTIIFVISSVITIFSLIKAQKNKNVFRKISLQGNEIEIFEEQDESYFDKYLNEVLYLFENVEANVIVFEDMDRFNSSRIFERLREVNTLINVNRKLNNGENFSPLRFFYLIRDDIFTTKDRTKFFDYIIPIIPIIDSSNSYEQFLKLLKQSKIIGMFEKSFLQSLTLYIDDMRILKNIYNEFMIYIHRLNNTDLNWNKMMAIIVYKNLFPRDFSDLQLDKGFVFEIFEQKQSLITDSLGIIRDQKEVLSSRLDRIKKESLISIEELQDAFSAKEKRLPRNYYSQNLTPDGIEMKKKNDIELEKRKQALNDMYDGNLSKIEREITKVEYEETRIHAKSIKELITKENVDKIFSVQHINEVGDTNEFKEIKCNDYFTLLKFLIRSGFIDETFKDYMTYFYDDSLSANDKTFLRRITDRRGAAYTYNLKEPKKIIDSPIIRSIEFEYEEILNFDLFEYLLNYDSNPKYNEYLKILITQLRQTGNYEFISIFYERNIANKLLIKKINNEWADFFSNVLLGNLFPLRLIRLFSIDTLYYSDKATIKEVNLDSCLTKYISSCQDYLNIDQPDIESLIKGFIQIGVSFNSIDFNVSNKELFDEVYKNSLYALNFKNIILMLRNKYNVENEIDIFHSNYSTIQKFPDSPLAKYVSDYITEYIELIIGNCLGEITDTEENAIKILNNKDLDTTIKEHYIEFLTTFINDITKIDDFSVWGKLVNQKNLVFTTLNFVNYFIKFGLDSTLINFLNNTQNVIDFTNVQLKFGDKVTEELFDMISICNKIENIKYRKILKDLNFYFDNYEAKNIEEQKVNIMIEDQILEMDFESLEFVRLNYTNNILLFIKRNLVKYLSLLTSENFNFYEAMQILSWDIEDESKLELLSLTNQEISILDKQYSDEVNSYIISNNLFVEDGPELFKNYTEYGTKTRQSIMNLIIEEIQYVISNNLQVDDNLISTLLVSERVSRKNKVLLFVNSIPNLNEDKCKVHFDELELSELKGIFSRGSGRRNYEKTMEVTTILESLKSNGWIYEYREDERNKNKYIIIKNRQ